MKKTILITGATDGIGLEAAGILVQAGHQTLIHGRSRAKLDRVATALSRKGTVETYLADLSYIEEVERLALEIPGRHRKLDVLINNAGVYNTLKPIASGGLDVRFVVNTIAPYLLTTRLLPLLGTSGRIINLSSAAQAPVDIPALSGRTRLSDDAAYAQSKLALTMWSRALAQRLEADGPAVIAVNPGSLLASKMVKRAYGVKGKDLRIGADILCRAALADDFAGASGQYFDNDVGQFASPHPDALDDHKLAALMVAIDAILARPNTIEESH